MPKYLSVFAVACFCLFSITATSSADFPGWQVLRVVEQDGRPYILRAADVDADGRQDLVVVNPRFSRLETYRWIEPQNRQEPQAIPADRPNELPTAPELKREEIQLEHLPQDLVVEDVDGDGTVELVVLVSPPNRVVVYALNQEKKWQSKYRIDLLDANIPTRRRAMLIRKTADDKRELLISCSDGIQQLDLQPEGRAHWLTPREKRDRTEWWLADLDGDGDEDLIEQSREADESIRWYPCSDDGTLLPAQILFDRSVGGAEVLAGPNRAELILLDGSVQGIIRRYQIGFGDESPLGKRHTLALVGGESAAWCGMRQGAQSSLVLADPNRPRIVSYGLSAEGWQSETAFPSVANVLKVVAPAAKPELLLMRVKDAADLYRSEWNDQRLTYPAAWVKDKKDDEDDDTDDRQIVALGQVADTAWWVQRAGKDLRLYRWSPGQDEPHMQPFAGVGGKAEEALWIGGERLLVKDTHARGLRLVQQAGDKATSASPNRLKKADLEDFKLFAIGDSFRLARFVDGVLQWLNDDLQSYEQIMLPDGQELADYVATSPSGGWGLQKESPFIHRLAADDAGVIRSTERIKVAAGEKLIEDPYLGLLLVNRDRLTQLSVGSPRQLDLVGMIDERIGRPGGVRETRFHRIGTADIDGDQREELILFDDMEHRLTALATNSDELSPVIAWQVFDDKIYPYSDEIENLVREPRAICDLDFDGDGHQDLAMLCHDRLLIYLGRTDR